MYHITTKFLKDILGADRLRQYAQLQRRFEETLHFFKGQYPSSKLGNKSLTMALTALEFVLNTEAYFNSIASARGKRFFEVRKDEFTKHFDYQKVLQGISKGDRMLFLYGPHADERKKLSADGVIGKFHSIEHFDYSSNRSMNDSGDAESTTVVLKLEISNNGIIDLPVVEMVYFGSWRRKLELIM
jgi:hypothetical protein